MKIRERLLECKIKLGIKSDYALADALGCSRQAVSELNKGIRKPDAFYAVKIGEILGIHPMILLAEFEGEKAKTAERRAFWENFGQRIKSGATAMLVLIFTVFWLPEPKAGELALDTHNVYYVKYTKHHSTLGKVICKLLCHAVHHPSFQYAHFNFI